MTLFKGSRGLRGVAGKDRSCVGTKSGQHQRIIYPAATVQITFAKLMPGAYQGKRCLKPNTYIYAIGELWATLVIVDGKDFLATESARYRAFVSYPVKQKYLKLNQGQKVYWHVYPQSGKLGLTFHTLSFAAQPRQPDAQFILQGDWLGSGHLKIWRNAIPGKVSDHDWQPKLLAISWSDPPATEPAFWQLKAELVNGILKIVAALGPFPHPPRLEQPPTETRLRRHQRGKTPKPPRPKLNQHLPTVSTNRDWSSLTPVSGCLELTLRLHTLPQVQQLNGQCHFQIDCARQVFQVMVKQKQWNKLENAFAAQQQSVVKLAGFLRSIHR